MEIFKNTSKMTSWLHMMKKAIKNTRLELRTFVLKMKNKTKENYRLRHIRVAPLGLPISTIHLILHKLDFFVLFFFDYHNVG